MEPKNCTTEKRTVLQNNFPASDRSREKSYREKLLQNLKKVCSSFLLLFDLTGIIRHFLYCSNGLFEEQPYFERVIFFASLGPGQTTARPFSSPAPSFHADACRRASCRIPQRLITLHPCALGAKHLHSSRLPTTVVICSSQQDLNHWSIHAIL